MEHNEQIIFNNSFGTISNKRVILNYKNGSEDIPIRQISSIAFERNRSIFLATIFIVSSILILIGLAQIRSVSDGIIVLAIIFFILFMLIGIAYYIGNHLIELNISDSGKKIIKVEMAKKQEGKAFFNAIRKQIIV